MTNNSCFLESREQWCVVGAESVIDAVVLLVRRLLLHLSGPRETLILDAQNAVDAEEWCAAAHVDNVQRVVGNQG